MKQQRELYAMSGVRTWFREGTRGWVAMTLTTCTLVTGCAVLHGGSPRSEQGSSGYAASVTITRDEWGIPAITAEDEASAAFGLAWAMAEDAFPVLEDAYMQAIGTASAYYGATRLDGDLLRMRARAVENARREFEAAPAAQKRVWQAYADGLNTFMRVRTDQHPKQITRFEGWMVVALANDIALMQPVTQLVHSVVQGQPMNDASGALMYALGPAHTGGGTLVLVQSHQPDPYEVDLSTADGWRMHGFAPVGSPFAGEGFTRTHAFAQETGTATADVIRVRLSRDSSAYDVITGTDKSAGRGSAHVITDSLRLNTSSGVVSRMVRVVVTDIGPVVATVADTSLVLRTDTTRGGVLRQWRDFAHAQDSVSFAAAIAERTTRGAVLFADSAGRLLMSDSGRIHSFSGQGMGGLAFDREEAAAAVFSRAEPWTIQRLIAAAFDTRVGGADAEIAALSDEWEQVGARSPERAMRVDSAVRILRDWDRTSSVTSTAMTLYATFQDQLRRRLGSNAPAGYERFASLEDVVTDPRLYPPRPWGSVNAAARPADGVVPAQRMPVAGAPARLGIIFAYDAALDEQSYVWIAELADAAGAAVMSFGQSSRPASQHWFDQAPLFAAGSLRPLSLRSAPAGTAYHPGDVAH